MGLQLLLEGNVGQRREGPAVAVCILVGAALEGGPVGSPKVSLQLPAGGLGGPWGWSGVQAPISLGASPWVPARKKYAPLR